MIYGSSPYTQRKIVGVTGSTGPTGNTGPDGNVGSTGNTGRTGNTGGSIIGMTLSNNTIVTTFDDNTSFVGSNIKGQTGNYYIFVDAQSIAGDGLSIVSGVSYEQLANGNVLGSIRLRGLTTASSRNGTAVITINSSIDSGVIGITYDLNNIAYLGISGGKTGQLVVYKSGTQFYGLTGTSYDSSDNTIDAQVMNYGERVEFVRPTKKTIYNPTDNSATVGRYFYWAIDWEKANTFVLNSYNDQTVPGENVVGQIVLVRNPPSSDVAKGITIIIPTGITSSIEVLTKYAVTDDLTAGITLDTGSYTISWPLSYPPCLSTGVDVINMVSLDNIWYANFGIYNNNTSQVDWNINYSNCLEGINLEDDEYITVDPNLGQDPVCTNLNQLGLCCIACSSGDSFVGTCESCKPYILAGTAQFFPGKGDGYAGCTAESDERGICCYVGVDGSIQKDLNPSGVRLCDCSRLSQDTTYPKWFKWTPFTECITSINSIDCVNAYFNIGGCCDGFGNCEETTESECTNSGRFFQGNGRACIETNGTETFNICSGKTGGCCINATCSDVSNGQTQCIDQGGKFYGCGYTCGSFDCQYAFKGCRASNADPFVVEQHWSGTTPLPDTWSYTTSGGSSLAGTGTVSHQLKVGDEFAGGIVVGIFKPKGTTCFGPTAMGGYPEAYIPPVNTNTPAGQGLFNYLNSGTEKPCDYYNSQYDPFGYGFTLTDNHNGEEDAWLLIVSKFPVIIEQKYCSDKKSINGIHTARVHPSLSLATPSIPTDPYFESASPNITNVGTSPNINQFRTIYSKNFRLTHGGTAAAFIPYSRSDLFQFSGSLYENTKPNYELCGGTDIQTAILFHDGIYGTRGATYWGNTNTFINCSNTPDVCTTCAEYPYSRRNSRKSIAKGSSTGYFSRNWGIHNTILLTESMISEFYLTPGNSLYPDGFSLIYGGSAGFTGIFDVSTPYTDQVTTAAEGCSIWNRYYYPSDLPPSTTEDGAALPSQYVPFNGPESVYNLGFGNNGWLGTLYPQLSRWYIPSIDELAFIAKACIDVNGINLQQKIEDAKGIRIGNLYLNSNSTSPLPFTDSNAGYVWSSTLTFDEGVTREYQQGITASSPQVVFGFPIQVDGASRTYTSSQLTNKKFTKAWAMKFSTGTGGAFPYPLPADFKAMKKNTFKSTVADITNDRLELRLVRQIRCDRKFYWNGDRDGHRNSLWTIPRLTPSDVVTGMPFESGGPVGATGFTFPNYTNTSVKLTNLNTFLGTIYKNRIT